jgi:hypothetical protein
MEGGVTSLVVFGGTGKYLGVIGEAKMESIGNNNAGNPNFRFTIKHSLPGALLDRLEFTPGLRTRPVRFHSL